MESLKTYLFKKTKGLLMWLKWLLIILLSIAAVGIAANVFRFAVKTYHSITDTQEDIARRETLAKNEAAAAALTSEKMQIAANKTNFLKEKEYKQYSAVSVVTNRIKEAQRNPASVKWEQIRANEDGSVICISYRSQNGFGGMNLEPAVFLNNKILMGDNARGDAWSKNCKKPMSDLTVLFE